MLVHVLKDSVWTKKDKNEVSETGYSLGDSSVDNEVLAFNRQIKWQKWNIYKRYKKEMIPLVVCIVCYSVYFSF